MPEGYVEKRRRVEERPRTTGRGRTGNRRRKQIRAGCSVPETGCLGDAQAYAPYTSGYAGAVNTGFNDCNNSMIHPSGTGVSIQAATTGIAVAPSGGSETRPVNASVAWIIKT